jgi:hypothetical protein
MNFYIVFCKNRRKIDKFMKVNRIRNKSIIDIKTQMEESDIVDEKYSEYLNLLIFSKIVISLRRGKDIYYIPNFDNIFDINSILDMKKNIEGNIKFNILIFFDDFREDNDIINDLFNNLHHFDISQIIKDY